MYLAKDSVMTIGISGKFEMSVVFSSMCVSGCFLSLCVSAFREMELRYEPNICYSSFEMANSQNSQVT